MYHTEFVVPKSELLKSEQDAKGAVRLHGIPLLRWLWDVSVGVEANDTTAAEGGRRG